MNRAVFLDKDGTLIENVPYNVDPERIVLAPGARQACRELDAAGFLLVLVTNQSGVARGLFPEAALAGVEAQVRRLIDVPLAAFHYCPHGPDDECACRKPSPGMLLEAARDLDIDLAQSWMIGDNLDDVEAGRRAGCRAILLQNGGETEWRFSEFREPTVTIATLADAALAVLADGVYAL